MVFNRSDQRVFDVNQSVRFNDQHLQRHPDAAKRFAGRVGVVTGYRQAAGDPIVVFPKDGRRKEQKLFEVPSSALEALPPCDSERA